MKRTVEFLVGGTVVYLSMAACAASGGKGAPDQNDDGQGGAPMAAAGMTGSPTHGGYGGAPSDGEAGSAAGQGKGSAGGGGTGGIFDPVPDANAATDGSRLKAKVIVGDDGSKQSTSLWHDTARNEECSYQLAADGTYRCLPAMAVFGPSYYSDSSCAPAKAVFLAPKSCADLPKYVTPVPPVAYKCEAGTRVYTLQESGPGTYYVGSPGACYASPSPANLYDTYALGDEVPLSSFARATLKVAP